MDYGIVLGLLGKLLILEAGLMTPSLMIALYTGDGDAKAFFISIVSILFIYLLIPKKRFREEHITVKEGLAIVATGWIILSLFGALPLFLSGSTKTYIDAFFETVSGFTTTGATILTDVESLPAGVLFWRSFTHWIGGMGILVFTISLLPALGIGGFQIFKAESPGPVAGKINPKIKDTAKTLYTIYFTITIIQVVLLILAGMNLFDSLVYTFGTVGTGGLATKGDSVGAYPNVAIHLIIGVFMVISGINFSLYYAAFKGRWDELFEDEELRLYLILVTVASLFIALNLFLNNYSSILVSLKDAFFQVGSIITTTGYSTVDFNQWPSFSKAILFLLMFVGGSAGSTAGGVKVIRVLVLLKLIKREILKIFHPRAIKPIKVNGKIMGEDTIEGINAFMALYMVIFLISGILISLENVDLLTAFSSVAATLGNIGPGFNLVGPASNFGFYSQLSKFYFSVLMLLGRLELFTIIALLVPTKWSKVK